MKIKRLTGGYHVLHRLDSVTSGCLCIPLTYFSQRLAYEAFKKGRVEKFYLALVYGKLEEKNMITIDMPIGENQQFHKYSKCTLNDLNGIKNENCFDWQKSVTKLKVRFLIA